MRTVLVYLIALSAVAAACLLGFPELFATAANGEAPPRPSHAPPVIAVQVAAAPFADTLEALGTVRANESVEITPNCADHVARIHFTDGQSVKKGDILLEMQAKEETALLTEAVALRDDRRLNHKRAKELFDQSLTSAREYDTAKALLAAAEARVLALTAAIADRTVVAPFSGVLGLRRVSVGAYIQPATLIATLDDVATVKVDFTVPEAWLTGVEPGMAIGATSVAFPDKIFRGEVTTIDTRLDPRTRSATFRALVPNPDSDLRPGMLLRLTIERGEKDVLQVPEEALVLSGDSHFVLRIDADDVARRTPVEVGRRRRGSVEVRSGLTSGDRVVIEGIVPVIDGIVDPQRGVSVRVVEVRKPKT